MQSAVIKGSKDNKPAALEETDAAGAKVLHEKHMMVLGWGGSLGVSRKANSKKQNLGK